MAFWEHDRDWDKFFLEEPTDEIREWIKMYDKAHPTHTESLEKINEAITDLEESYQRAKDSRENLKADLAVMERMVDSAKWALDKRDEH